MLKQNLGQHAYVEYDGWATVITTKTGDVFIDTREIAVTLTPDQAAELVKFLYFVQTATSMPVFPGLDLKKSKTTKTSSK